MALQTISIERPGRSTTLQDLIAASRFPITVKKRLRRGAARGFWRLRRRGSYANEAVKIGRQSEQMGRILGRSFRST